MKIETEEISIETSYGNFSVRQFRPQFVLDQFPEIFSSTVLDIGSDAGVIKAHLGPEKVTGVDLNPAADITINLDEVEQLPFEDGQFKTVLCLDVLEHLENLHRIMAEAVRVSSRWVLISLPNPWASARLRIARGKGSIVHYGLPLEPTQDRHRWFFSCGEALDFLVGMQNDDLNVRSLMTVEKPVPAYLRWFRRFVYFDPLRYRNRYIHTVICLFEKSGNHGD